MARTNEEIAADLVWRYVEHLRERADAGNPDGLTHPELDELLEAMDAAGALPPVFQPAPDLPRQASVRARVEDRLKLAAEAPVPARTASLRPQARVPRFRGGKLRPAWSAVALFGAALLTVNLWHRPAPVVRHVVVPVGVRNVEPMDESRAHLLIPRMVRDELNSRDERDLMWHLLVCPGCFQDYEALRRSRREQQASSGEPWWQFVKR